MEEKNIGKSEVYGKLESHVLLLSVACHRVVRNHRLSIKTQTDVLSTHRGLSPLLRPVSFQKRLQTKSIVDGVLKIWNEETHSWCNDSNIAVGTLKGGASLESRKQIPDCPSANDS